MKLFSIIEGLRGPNNQKWTAHLKMTCVGTFRVSPTQKKVIFLKMNPLIFNDSFSSTKVDSAVVISDLRSQAFSI